MHTKFIKGQIVILDKPYNSTIEVEIVSQSPKRLFTRIRHKEVEYDVMTLRLSQK